MLSQQTDVFDVAIATAVFLQDRATSALQRTFVFQNLTASELTLTIEESADGATWTVVGVAFTVGIAGGGSDYVIKNIASGNALRVKGSGGAADRDLLAAILRVYADTDVPRIWARPSL